MATPKQKTENVRIANYGTHSNQDNSGIAEDSMYRSITPNMPISNPQTFRTPMQMSSM